MVCVGVDVFICGLVLLDCFRYDWLMVFAFRLWIVCFAFF